MEQPVSYRTLHTDSYGEYREKGSKFLAYAFPVYNDEDIQEAQARVRKDHAKARHHCYAWRLGLDGNQYRANDDGEPSGTAGRPILGQIDRLELTNVQVIVVRYFGGTLLGTSGLIRAYKAAAAEALDTADIWERYLEDVYRLAFDYQRMPLVMAAISNLGLNVIAQDFGNSGQMDIAIPKAEVPPTLLKLKAQVAEVYEEEVDGLEKIEGFEVAYLKTI
jgi:uncharacterized YigZ family protein